MSLNDLIKRQRPPHKKAEINLGEIKGDLEKYRDIISYWRMYPDRLIDFYCSLNPHNTFKFYFFQRLYLRVSMRYKTIYATFSRGFSKSFLAVMSLMLKAILYPGATLATVSDGERTYCLAAL